MTRDGAVTSQLQLSQVPLTESARKQLRRARIIVAAWAGFGLVCFVGVIVIALVTVKHPHWVAAITPIVLIAGLLAFALFRLVQIGQDLKADSMTRFTGTFREMLSSPMRNQTFLRVKLPGRFMLLRSSVPSLVNAAAEAGCERRWTATIGHLDYSTRSKLLIAVERDPV
jgi:hypothetical protein